LHVVLQQSFSADAAIRKPAEDTIRNLKNLPGSVVLLLQVAAEKQVRVCCRCTILTCILIALDKILVWTSILRRCMNLP